MWYLGKMTSPWLIHALRMREIKKKRSKKVIRTVATRSACKRLADCANRTLWVNLGEIIFVVVLFPRITFPRDLRRVEGLFLQNQEPKYFSLASGTNNTKVAQQSTKGKRIAFQSTVLAANALQEEQLRTPCRP